MMHAHSYTPVKAAAAAKSRQQSAMDAHLQPVFERHLLWLQTQGRDGKRANLAGEDLSGCVLKNHYLADANFRGAQLSGVDFSGSNLQGADFSEATLSNANFRGALLDGANFTRTSAQHIYLDECSAVGANFSHALMHHASATGADFTGAKMRDMQAEYAQFSACLMVQADMRQSRFTNACFDGANLSQSDARGCVFDHARFKSAILNGLQLRDSSFDQVMLAEADFSVALELPAYYQSESFAMQRLAMHKELENLAKKREELDQVEQKNQQARYHIAQQRKHLAAVTPLDEDMAKLVLAQVHFSRKMAMLWFIAVAVSATLLADTALQKGIDSLKTPQMLGIIGGALIVLAAHFFAAMRALHTAKTYSGFLRLRADKLAQAKQKQESAPAATDTGELKSTEVTYL